MTVAAAPKAAVRAPHPLRAETVRGFAPFAGAAVTLTLGAMLAASSARWQGGWAETAAEVHGALLISVPLAAAAGCWQGGRERRRGTEELWRTVVRTPLVRFLASALPVALWVAAGYLVTVGLALLATWSCARGDGPRLALLPGDTVTMAAAALTGHVVGRVVPTRLAAPLLAMAGYVVLGTLTAAHSGGASFLNPALPVAATEVPVWWLPWVTTGWTGGLALAAGLAYAARRRVTAVLPLAAAVAAGALLVQTGDGLLHADPLARRQVCDTSVAPAVCVNARYPDLLPQVTSALSGVTGKLEGVRNLPVRWADRAGRPRAHEAQLPMLTPLGWYVVRGRLIEREEFAWEAVQMLSGSDCPPEELTDRVLVADDAVSSYLAPSPLQKEIDRDDAEGDAAQRAQLRERRAARARLAGMGARERREWLSAYFAARGDCGVKGVPSL
ncbi:hypothetical protein GCM10010503_11400 [Streptomyces lucensis JCM 4490]|uniref:Uncharacterized protein n=1 Tax=Streptomyces lucensis JCM 4490 TaxID=1306176 RepID=A0A918MMH4_9ACTN|nr:hypothetical protein [Streptomyces lucensis]GGW37162.1 hypothetical protein GCM10010503_11400 [Streptomyces lucensis JCM 4490]